MADQTTVRQAFTEDETAHHRDYFLSLCDMFREDGTPLESVVFPPPFADAVRDVILEARGRAGLPTRVTDEAGRTVTEPAPRPRAGWDVLSRTPECVKALDPSGRYRADVHRDGTVHLYLYATDLRSRPEKTWQDGDQHLRVRDLPALRDALDEALRLARAVRPEEAP